jgi:hypothetical protein
MGRILPVTTYWYYSGWAYMKEWCYQKHPNTTGSALYYDHCALAHINEKANLFWVPWSTWWDMNDFSFSHSFRENEFKLADRILYVGVALNAFGIILPRNVVLVFAFWTNLAMASMYTFEWT